VIAGHVQGVEAIRPVVRRARDRGVATLSVYTFSTENWNRPDDEVTGLFGLIDAIRKFDTDRNIKFETYAIARIKGAIIDELRSLDWVPRSLRSKAKDLERAYANLEYRLRRAPSDAEVAQELGITNEEYQTLLTQLSYTSVVALDELWNVKGERGDKVSLMETIEDTKSKDPQVTAEFEETKRLLADCIDRLPPKEKIVIALYYYEGLTLREIGEILSITESRVSQLHTKAVLRLRGNEITTPTIVLVALLLISGSQFTLFAMWFDMESNKDLK